MALSALKRRSEDFVESRLARLEANVEHIQTDVSDIKADTRGLRQDVKLLCEKINDVDKCLSDKLSALTVMVEKGFARMDLMRMVDRIWHLLTSAALLAVMARAFKWI